MSARAVLERALLLGVLWLLGGGVGLVAGAAFVVYDLVSRPAPRAAETVGPGFVEGNLVAHYLAGAGLALLVVGVLRDVRGGPGPPGDGAAGDGLAGGEDQAGRRETPALPAPPEERP